MSNNKTAPEFIPENNLKSLRAKTGLSLLNTSKKLGMSVEGLRKFENRVLYIYPKQLSVFTEYYKVDKKEIISEVENLLTDVYKDWKPIEFFGNGKYVATIEGVVIDTFRNRILAVNLREGYPSVMLSSGGINKHHCIHRIVAVLFMPNINNLPCINHIDGNKQNNAISNLEWCTYAENSKHMFDVLGRKIVHSEQTKHKISLSNKGKVRSEEIRKKMSLNYKPRECTPETRMKLSLGSKGKNSCKVFSIDNKSVIVNYSSIKEATEKTGIKQGSISNVLTGRSKTASGLKWEYGNR